MIQQHKLIDIEGEKPLRTGARVVAVCACGWKSLPTTLPIRSIDQHVRRIRGLR